MGRWKRCWMEKEQMGGWKRNRRGGVEEVLDGRGNRWDGGKRCWMEEETDGMVEEVFDGRGNRWGWKRCWMEEEQMGGRKVVGWKRKPMMRNVVEGKETGAKQRKRFDFCVSTGGGGGDADDTLSKQIGTERQTETQADR